MILSKLSLKLVFEVQITTSMDNSRIQERFDRDKCMDDLFPSQLLEEEEEDIDFPEYCYSSKKDQSKNPMEIAAFLTLVLLKLAGFQINLVLRFITLPYSILNFWLTLFLLPFKAVRPLARDHLIKLPSRMLSGGIVVSFVCNRIKIVRMSSVALLKFVLRFCWALFWSVYGCLVLVGLLVMGFIIGGITIRHLVVEPIQTTENLNFDYTKTSPVAFVPLVSTPIVGVSPALISKDKIPFPKSAGGGRSIPYDHKLKLAVSLTMPEFEYNRNLGIFQVRVECLSADGKVTASSSYPSMLKFKSEPIRFVETMFKTVPLLLTGFQSEIQNLKIQEIEFAEGYEPTACFKVIIEQRAECEPGFGIPEIYAASLHVESELPPLKRLIWNWRRTLFVWISFISFLTQLWIALFFLRPIIFPGRTLLLLGAKAKTASNKILWSS